MQPANTLVELTAGPFAAAVATIWSGDRLTEFLIAPDRRRQVWYACLASPYGNFSPERNDIDLLYTRLTSWRAKALVVQAYGCRPRGALGVIGRLGSRARDPEVYQLLIDVMERGGPGAKLLMHGEELSDQLIETIAAVPADMTWPALDAMLDQLRIEIPENLAMLLWTVARLQTIDRNPAVAAILTAAKPVAALLTCLVHRPFPPPPWLGTRLLVPLTSGRDLLRTGDTFHNCLGEDKWGEAAIMAVLNGTRYVYEWRGPEPAMIELLRVADIGWYVGEAHGMNNADLSRQTRKAIAKEFEAAPHICATRLVVRSNIYPCSRFWGEIVCRAMMR